MMLGPKYTTYHSTVLDADPDTTWEQVRDFLQMLAIAFGDSLKSAHWLKGGSVSKVPSLCRFVLLPNEDVAEEEVIGRSEHDRSLTYRTVGQVLQIAEYVGSYQVLPVTNEPNRCFFSVAREFRLVEDADPQFLSTMLALMDQETDNIKAHFASA